MSISFAVALAVASFFVIVILPVKATAILVSAAERGWFRCLASAIASLLIAGFAGQFGKFAGFCSIFAVGAVYMLVLETTYLRGLVVAALQGILGVIFFAIAITAAPNVLRTLGFHVVRL